MKGRSKNRSKRATSEKAAVEKLYKTLHVDKRIYSRWIAGPEQTISTSVGGTVALTTMANAASISSAPDFASLAVVYTAYRCKAMRVQVFPFYSAPVYTGAAVNIPPAILAIFPWTSNSVPTTFAQAQDVTGVHMMSGFKGAVVVNSYRGDPDAHLWTGTGAAIGSGEQFGISCIGTAATSTASLPVFRVLVDYLVEFRMAG